MKFCLQQGMYVIVRYHGHFRRPPLFHKIICIFISRIIHACNAYCRSISWKKDCLAHAVEEGNHLNAFRINFPCLSVAIWPLKFQLMDIRSCSSEVKKCKLGNQKLIIFLYTIETQLQVTSNYKPHHGKVFEKSVLWPKVAVRLRS